MIKEDLRLVRRGLRELTGASPHNSFAYVAHVRVVELTSERKVRVEITTIERTIVLHRAASGDSLTDVSIPKLPFVANLGNRIGEVVVRLVRPERRDTGEQASDIKVNKSSFTFGPSVVSAVSDDVDLFDIVTPSVGHNQLTALREAKVVGVVETESVDFIEECRVSNERIVAGNGVRLGSRLKRVDTKDLTKSIISLASPNYG
mmetsp:Transcript_20940/g.42199  ORF Transcript_20940/g.42199 Transcript_20940/m.42199 type:complete len:204 (-) Transcript_20940:674-1285(-)